MRAAVIAGALVVLAVSATLTSAADQTVTAGVSSWDKTSVTIAAGEMVTWRNPSSGGGHHNIVVKQGSTVLMRKPDGGPSSSWPQEGYSYRFANPGSYTFLCEPHSGSMTGTVTVNAAPANTPTATPTASATSTASATATATPTATPSAAPDVTAPAFVGKLRRRATRTTLRLALGSSEDATLEVVVSRRAPRARSFRELATSTRQVRAGRNEVTLLRVSRKSRLRAGSYRVRLALEDAAGNRSAARTLRFKVSG